MRALLSDPGGTPAPGHRGAFVLEILGVELLCAAQGVEFRAPLSTSEPLQRVLAVLRGTVPTLREDRFLSPDIEAAAGLVAGAAITEAIDIPMPPLLP